MLFTRIIASAGAGWCTASAESAAGGAAAQTSRSIRRHLARSTGPRWEPAGFGGAGAFIGITFDRAHPGLVYASSDVAGVFRSSDYGDRWEMRSVGLGNLEISSLAVDPFDSNTLYAGAGALAESNNSGMYVTHDAGATWQLLPATHANGMTFRRMRTLDAIAPDRTQRGVIIAGTRGNGIWRTLDFGATWTQVLAAPVTNAAFFQPGAVPDDPAAGPHPAPVATIAFDPENAAVVYAALDGAGVFKSNSGGVEGSWHDASAGLPAQAPVRDLGASRGGTVYVAMAGAGVARSVNGGASWTLVNGNLPLAGVEISSVAAHPSNPLIAYVALVTYAHPNVWKTADGGATWTPQGVITFDQQHDPTREWNQGQTYTWQVRLDPANPNRIYQVDFWGIIRSDDAAATANEKIVGAQDTCVSGLTVDADHPPGEPDTLYATQWDAGVVASTDKGATWTAVQPRTWQADYAGHYWDFAVIRVGGTKYYLTTSTTGEPEVSRVQRSTDARSWTTTFSLPTPPAAFVETVNLAVDPANPARLYMSVASERVYVSSDGGATWAPTPGQPGDNSFTYALEVDDRGTILVGTLRDGLWRSLDGGARWERVLAELGTVLRLAVAPGVIYAAGIGSGTDLCRSTDGGTTWQAIAALPVADDGDGVGAHGMAIAVDPANPRHLYFSMADTWHNCDAGTGVAESVDGGATWAWVNSGLGLLSVGVLTVGSDGTVYAGTSCGSVWRRSAR